MAHVDSSTYASLGTNHDADYSDGPFIETATGQVVTLKDSVPVAFHDVSLHCRVFEDFLGNTDLPRTGDTVVNTSSPFFMYDKSDAGSPTLGAKADIDSGVYELTSAANDEVVALVIDWNSNRGIDPAQGPIATFRLTTAATGAANDKFVFGLGSDRADDPDSVASNAWFCIAGANLNLLVESDNGTTDNDDDDTGVDVVAGTYYEYRVDASDYTDVRFLYRTSLGGTWTDITPAGVTYVLHATTNLQPYVHCGKASGAGTPSLLIDYVDVTWKRS